MILESLITCPHCGTAKTESMPTDACQFSYECSGCGARLRPNRAIAVCSVPLAGCPVRRFRPSAPVRGAQPTLHGEGIMANDTIQASRDWLANTRATALAWWIPQVAIVGGLFVPGRPIRAAIWTIALIWMGTACILNAGQCGRTHCRYTGPFYLAMIAPVLVFGSDIASAGIYGWIVLAVLIIGGGKVIWWATERAWGKFS
jgi:hypothetical protein